MEMLIIFAAKYLFIVIGLIAVAFFIVSEKSIKIRIVKLSLIALPLSFIIAKVLNFIISSPRPFVLEHISPLIHASTDNGFPSDHTLFSMTIATIVFAYNRKLGGILIILSVFVGIARVLARVHHPIDVIGSIIIALIATYVSYRYLVKLFTYKLPLLES